MKNCKFCGCPMDDVARFCPSCGKPVVAESRESSSTTTGPFQPKSDGENMSYSNTVEGRFSAMIHHRMFLPVLAAGSTLLVFLPWLISLMKPVPVAPVDVIEDSLPEATPIATPYVEDLTQYPVLEPSDFLSTMIQEDDIKCGVCGVVLVSEYEAMMEEYHVCLTDGTNSVNAYYSPDAECIEQIKQLREGNMIICYGIYNNSFGSPFLNKCFGISDTGRNYWDEQQAEANDLSNYQHITLEELSYEAKNNTDLYMSNNYYGHYLAISGDVNDVYITDEGDYCVYLSIENKGAYDYLKAYFPPDTEYLDDITNLRAGEVVVCYGKLSGTDYGLTFEMAQCVCLETSAEEQSNATTSTPTLSFDMLDFGGGYIDNYGTDAITKFTQDYELANNPAWEAYTDANETIFTNGDSVLSVRGRNDFGVCGIFLGTSLTDAYQIAQQYGCDVSAWEDGSIDFSASYHGYDIYYETDFGGDGTVSEIYVYRQ